MGETGTLMRIIEDRLISVVVFWRIHSHLHFNLLSTKRSMKTRLKNLFLLNINALPRRLLKSYVKKMNWSKKDLRKSASDWWDDTSLPLRMRSMKENFRSSLLKEWYNYSILSVIFNFSNTKKQFRHNRNVSMNLPYIFWPC